MKALAFLKLVGEMLTSQQDYWSRRKHSDLIKAKQLEKQVMAVVKEGKLEPDVVTTAEIAEPTQLDFVADRRPNVPEQKPLFTEGEQ
jgi:hypothetical protein